MSRPEESDTEASDDEEVAVAEPGNAGPSEGEVDVHLEGEREMIAFLAEMEEKDHGWPRRCIGGAEDIASDK